MFSKMIGLVRPGSVSNYQEGPDEPGNGILKGLRIYLILRPGVTTAPYRFH